MDGFSATHKTLVTMLLVHSFVPLLHCGFQDVRRYWPYISQVTTRGRKRVCAIMHGPLKSIESFPDIDEIAAASGINILGARILLLSNACISHLRTKSQGVKRRTFTHNPRVTLELRVTSSLTLTCPIGPRSKQNSRFWSFLNVTTPTLPQAYQGAPEMLIPPSDMALPIIKTIADCADFSKTVEPYLPQLYALPSEVVASITDIEGLKHL